MSVRLWLCVPETSTLSAQRLLCVIRHLESSSSHFVLGLIVGACECCLHLRECALDPLACCEGVQVINRRGAHGETSCQMR